MLHKTNSSCMLAVSVAWSNAQLWSVGLLAGVVVKCGTVLPTSTPHGAPPGRVVTIIFAPESAQATWTLTLRFQQDSARPAVYIACAKKVQRATIR